jgi:PKD repeat protein
VTTIAVNGLNEGTTYYFAVTAYDTAKLESVYSNEVSFTVPYGPPVVNFSASPGSGTAPTAVTFSNSTTGTVTSWQWSFGDGGTSTVQSPRIPSSATVLGHPERRPGRRRDQA